MANKKTSIGGQALLEGIMMRGPEKTAMAVRNTKGSIVVEEWCNKGVSSKFLKLPIIRGVYSMITSMVLGYRCMMRSADIAISDIMEEETQENKKAEGIISSDQIGASPELTNNPLDSDTEKKWQEEDFPSTSPISSHKQEKKKESSPKKDDQKSNNVLVTLTMVISILVALAFMIVAFVWFPSFLGRLIFQDRTGSLVSIGRSAFEGILKVILLVLYMWLISFMKDIRRTFSYHGAEHKTIFCYEQGLPLTVENIRKQRRFHPRCGTSFLILMVIVSIFIGFFVPTFPQFGSLLSSLLRSAIKILLLPLTIGIGYELIKLAGRRDNLLTRIISAPGVALQHITVHEPDDSMIECAIEAMKRVIPDDPDKDNW